MKKIWGNIIFTLARVIDFLLGGLIKVFEFIVEFAEQVKKIIFLILGVGILITFTMPLLLILFLTPPMIIFISIILILLLIPLLASAAISALKYSKYVITEFLYDYADFYRLGKDKNKKMSDYSMKYKRQKEEEERKAREENQRRINEEWQRRFDEFFKGAQGNFNSGRSSGYNNTGGSNTYNPTNDFNRKYEESCSILEVDKNTDIYQVKLQYRKMAKKYHPDLNQSPGATEKFRKINEAYEFLSEENIDRYKRLNNIS